MKDQEEDGEEEKEGPHPNFRQQEEDLQAQDKRLFDFM